MSPPRFNYSQFCTNIETNSFEKGFRKRAENERSYGLVEFRAESNRMQSASAVNASCLFQSIYYFWCPNQGRAQDLKSL